MNAYNYTPLAVYVNIDGRAHLELLGEIDMALRIPERARLDALIRGQVALINSLQWRIVFASTRLADIATRIGNTFHDGCTVDGDLDVSEIAHGIESLHRRLNDAMEHLKHLASVAKNDLPAEVAA